MKKIIALLLVLMMTLTVVLTACGEEKTTDSSSESASSQDNTTGGTEKPAETEKQEESTAEPAATSGNNETGKTPDESGAKEREPIEPLSGDDYTKVSSAPSVIGLFASLINELSVPFEGREVDLSDTEAIEFTYFKSLPTYYYDFETGEFAPIQSETTLLADIDFTKLSFIFGYTVDNGEYGSSPVQVYTAEDDDLGKVFVITAPGLLSKNLVIDFSSAMKISSTVLGLLSSYIGSLAGDDDGFAPILGESKSGDEYDGGPIITYGAGEGSSIPFVTYDDEGKMTIDPAVMEIINSLISIISDGSITDSLNYFSKAASNDMLKLLLPKDDTLTKAEFVTAGGETVETELATVQLNGFMAKMMLLSLANRVETDDFTDAYNKIRAYLPEDIAAYLPDVSAVVSLIRSAAEEIGLNEGIVINRYILDGESICDEIILDGSIVKAIRESAYEDDEYDWDDDDDVIFEEDYYGEDGEDGEWDDGEWDDGEWEEPEMLYGTMRFEYYNGTGKYTFVETYPEDEVYTVKDYSFGKDEEGYYFQDNDFFRTVRKVISIDGDGYTLISAEVSGGEMPDTRTTALRIDIVQEGGSDIGVRVSKLTEYKYYYSVWDDEGGDDYEYEVEEGSTSATYFFGIKKIDPFTNALDAEVKDNRYDISNMMGLMEIYSDIYDKYGFIIDALIAKLSGGGEDYE
ncbi:MAG: hypothetical protein J5940_05055 [Clostridia bacterium]|nr:hypothetical protein [Clostridia bacterium]